jgi:endonuclease-3
MDSQKAERIISTLKKSTNYTPKLNHINPLQLLVATILAAQSTDKQINKITPRLFGKYKTAEDYAGADIKELEEFIHSSGFYHNKAKNIKAACGKIVEEFGGKVPRTMEGLTSLPGIGRKTANIVLTYGFNTPVGIAVDTHVARVSQRLGFTKNKDPNKIEQDLLKLVPKKEWKTLNHLLVDHGRNVCQARMPECPECSVRGLCSSAPVFLDKYYSQD